MVCSSRLGDRGRMSRPMRRREEGQNPERFCTALCRNLCNSASAVYQLQRLPRPFLRMRYLKTSEAAALLNVSPNTLRAWERRFGFPKPQRSPGKHRLFTHGEVAALRDALQEGLRSPPLSPARARDSPPTATRSSARLSPMRASAPTPRSKRRSRCAPSSARWRRCCCRRSTRSRAATEPNRPRGRSPRIGGPIGCAARSGWRRRRCARSRSWSATHRATSSTRTPRTSARSSCSASAPASRF